MPRTPRTKSKGKAHKHSFRLGESGKLKIRKLLRDIQEARSYGIALRNDISLNQLYFYLTDARNKKPNSKNIMPKVNLDTTTAKTSSLQATTVWTRSSAQYEEGR